MRKILLLLLIPFLLGTAPTRQVDYTEGEIIYSANVESNENAVLNYLQAGVDTYATDSIKDTHIDFGTGTNQVSQDDVTDGTTYKQYNPASVAITGGTITGITDLAVADGGTGASTLSDGFVLLGNGTSAIQTLDVTGNGTIIIGDGTTDPTTLSAFTSSTGTLKHEYGGLEADISGYSNGLYGQLSNATADIDTSSELASAISDETGTGNLVYSVSPTFTGTIEATSLNASDTVTGLVVDTQYLEYSSGGALTVRDDLNVIGTTNLDGVLQVDNVGNSYVVGNIGIGTTGPDAKLDIEGTTGVYLADSANVAHGMTAIVPTDTYGVVSKWGGSSGGLMIRGLADSSYTGLLLEGIAPTLTAGGAVTLRAGKTSGTGATVPAATDIAFTFENYNANSQFVTILGNGNVGIGTTAPGELLDVRGTITTSVGIDGVGAVDLDYGSADITDHTFITDGTGTAEIVLPNDAIGDTEIDWGSGAGQVSGADITFAEGDMTDSTIVSADIKDGVIVGADINANFDLSGIDLELPQASPAAPDADGEIELDLTDNTLVVQSTTDNVWGKKVHSWTAVLAFPDLLQAEIDNWIFKAIDASEFPHGIVVTEINLRTSAASTYAVNVENWDDPTTINGVNPTIDAITTSASTEVSETTITYSTIAAGQLIVLDLDTDDIGWISVEIQFVEPVS